MFDLANHCSSTRIGMIWYFHLVLISPDDCPSSSRYKKYHCSADSGENWDAYEDGQQIPRRNALLPEDIQNSTSFVPNHARKEEGRQTSVDWLKKWVVVMWQWLNVINRWDLSTNWEYVYLATWTKRTKRRERDACKSPLHILPVTKRHLNTSNVFLYWIEAGDEKYGEIWVKGRNRQFQDVRLFGPEEHSVLKDDWKK